MLFGGRFERMDTWGSHADGSKDELIASLQDAEAYFLFIYFCHNVSGDFILFPE